MVGALRWQVEQEVQEALRGQSIPDGCPRGRLFVPQAARSLVLTWGHASRIACHPGVHRTLALVRQRFWWPSMAANVRTFIAACARSKTSHRPPAGLLQPQPIPSRPWSHIAVDFVTGLPLSEGNDTILTVVDRFSKAVHFVPLPKLRSALETANLLINHVFRLHGITLDIVSDRGPQFTSQVWKTFCKALGATPSLTSGYHPQSNGQAERATPRPWNCSPLHRVQAPLLLGHPSAMGGVCSQYTNQFRYRLVPLHGQPWLPASPLPFPGDRRGSPLGMDIVPPCPNSLA